MSWDALSWAAKQRVGQASDKLILLALAERHNPESGVAYPSVSWLAEFGSLNRKTVITALDRLEAAGFISDSGQRHGKTNQVKAYTLHLETVPKVEQSLNRNSSVFSGKESQKRDTDTVMEPVGSEAKASSPRPWAKPAGVDGQVWIDLLGNRKRKHKINSPTAWKRFNDDLNRVSLNTGIPPPQLIEHAAASGWAGIYDPNEQRNGSSHGRQQHSNIGPTAEAYAILHAND